MLGEIIFLYCSRMPDGFAPHNKVDRFKLVLAEKRYSIRIENLLL